MKPVSPFVTILHSIGKFSRESPYSVELKDKDIAVIGESKTEEFERNRGSGSRQGLLIMKKK